MGAPGDEGLPGKPGAVGPSGKEVSELSSIFLDHFKSSGQSYIPTC